MGFAHCSRALIYTSVFSSRTALVNQNTIIWPQNIDHCVSHDLDSIIRAAEAQTSDSVEDVGIPELNL